MRHYSALQQVKEAKQIAADHGMFVAEVKTRESIDYVVYRRVPGGQNQRLGKRGTPEGLRSFVSKCAGYR